MDQQHPKPVRKPIRAAQYVRMSTEHQQYSTENQSDAREPPHPTSSVGRPSLPKG